MGINHTIDSMSSLKCGDESDSIMVIVLFLSRCHIVNILSCRALIVISFLFCCCFQNFYKQMFIPFLTHNCFSHSTSQYNIFVNTGYAQRSIVVQLKSNVRGSRVNIAKKKDIGSGFFVLIGNQYLPPRPPPAPPLPPSPRPPSPLPGPPRPRPRPLPAGLLSSLRKSLSLALSNTSSGTLIYLIVLPRK